MSRARHKTSKPHQSTCSSLPMLFCLAKGLFSEGVLRQIFKGLRVSFPQSGQASKEDTLGHVFLQSTLIFWKSTFLWDGGEAGAYQQRSWGFGRTCSSLL